MHSLYTMYKSKIVTGEVAGRIKFNLIFVRSDIRFTWRSN